MLKKIILLTTLLTALPMHAQTIKSYIPNEWQDSRYTVHNNGTATDNTTKLMWKVCSEGQTWTNNSGAGACSGTASLLFWKGALEQAVTVNADPTMEGLTVSYTDWRVPNLKELQSIVALDRYSPAINISIFPNTPQSATYWSSSPYAGNSSHVGLVSFDYGYDRSYIRANGNLVRLVRSSQ